MAAFGTGVVLQLLGLRGKQIDAHQLCRKCGYDLTGKPLESTRCSECGADLAKPRAIRVGHRVKRRGLLWTGAVLILGSVVGVAASWRALRDWDLTPHKPLWLLQRESLSASPPTRTAAFSEIRRRFDAGELTASHMHSLAMTALQVQKSPTLPWAPWGILMFDARMAGKIADKDWINLIHQILTPNLTVRPRIRAGDAAVLLLDFRGSKLPAKKVPSINVGAPPTSPHLVEIEWLSASISGISSPRLPSRPGRYGGYPFIEDESFRASFDGSLTAPLAIGVHPAKARVRVHVLDSSTRNRVDHFDIETSTVVDILPAQTPVAELYVSDPDLESKLMSAITSKFSVRGPSGYWVDFNVRSLPVGLLHRGYLRLPDQREIPWGIFGFPVAYGGGQGKLFQIDLEGADAIDLVLKPDLDLLLNSARTDPIWGEEIVIHFRVP